MRHGFSTIAAIVDDHPKAVVRKACSAGDFTNATHHVAENACVIRFSCCDAWNRLAWHKHEMHGSLRGNVPKTNAEFVFIDDACRNFARADFFKQSRHGEFIAQHNQQASVENALDET